MKAFTLPPSMARRRPPLCVTEPGRWGVLNDFHVPFHDVAAVAAAVDHCRREKVAGIFINGDFLDADSLSGHDRTEAAVRLDKELKAGRQLLQSIRKQFPRARIIYKEGNHENRLQRYVLGKAPALDGLSGWPTMLGLADLGIEWVADKRVVRLGKLNTVHGHEYKGGGGANPASWILAKAMAPVMCAHLHKTDESARVTITGKPLGAWAVGCLCDLTPEYATLNQWNHGLAIVDVRRGGMFAVSNRRIIGGRVV